MIRWPKFDWVLISLGYYQNSDQKLRLADGRRELLPDEITEIPMNPPSTSASDAQKHCGVLKDNSENIAWTLCNQDARHYLCEYKGILIN